MLDLASSRIDSETSKSGSGGENVPLNLNVQTLLPRGRLRLESGAAMTLTWRIHMAQIAARKRGGGPNSHANQDSIFLSFLQDLNYLLFLDVSLKEPG